MPDLRYPVIVKPNAEGSSKGVRDACVAGDAESLRALLQKDLSVYGEPMLCEEYIAGREFTVGILGNGAEARAFPPMEIVFRRGTGLPYDVYSFDVKQNYKQFIDYRCPAPLTPDQTAEMENAALAVFRLLGCRDFTRVDFRMDAEENIYFIEMNPLPGLAPGYSDYPMLAEFCGVPYDALVLSVLRTALKRLGMEVSE
jgi:D-alanine-D-alanine ligase